MAMRVPAQGADALAALDAELFQSPGQAMNALVKVGVGVAMHRAVFGFRRDLFFREQPRGALQQRSQRQRRVHHQALHLISISATYPIPITARNIPRTSVSFRLYS